MPGRMVLNFSGLGRHDAAADLVLPWSSWGRHEAAPFDVVLPEAVRVCEVAALDRSEELEASSRAQELLDGRAVELDPSGRAVDAAGSQRAVELDPGPCCRPKGC